MPSAVVGHLPQLSEARFGSERIADEDQLCGALGAQQAQGVADCARRRRRPRPCSPPSAKPCLAQAASTLRIAVQVVRLLPLVIVSPGRCR
jgi:hypothetical protein